MQPDKEQNNPSLALDILGLSSKLATLTLTLSPDPIVSLVPARAATASNQDNQPAGVTMSLQRCLLHVY